MLEKLSKAQVFDIEPCGLDFEIWEGCDNYYQLKLSRYELEQLGHEIIALARTSIAKNEKSH